MKGTCRFCGGKTEPLSGDFYRCRSCGSVINRSFLPASYSDTYFTDDYRSQYGRTYEEDFPAVYSFAQKRIRSIIKTAGRIPSSVLDVGAALGFFLKAAEDAGVHDLFAIEISHYASRYIKEKFGYGNYEGSFETFSSARQYDAVTAWYFIEHTSDIRVTLARLTSFVAPGGMLAFAIPTVHGPSFRCNRIEWYKDHPADHSADLTPKAIRKILTQEGFSKITIKPASFHPERVFRKKSFLFPLFAFFFKIYARIFVFSDTIEVYAVKRARR